ncbi:BLUF domain-containing protein [Actinoplanes sp. NPDC051494]|uniref:BLUF domain-containing protein n=1 Tax=Actinoplanes sp. NPDC051494 TaxID=3363907 RepID=UPI0037A5AA95
MSLTQLIYSSRRSDTLPPEGIFTIRDQACANNARNDLTGVLLFDRHTFLQCLEGDREQVTRTFCTIGEDPRHTHVALVSVRDIEQPSFPDWSMGLVDGNSPSLRADLGDVLTGDEFSPGNLPAEKATTVMQRMRTLRYSY